MKYICFYSTESDQDLCLSTSPAGINKGTYVAKLLHETGHSVEIISPAWSKCGRWKYWKARTVSLEQDITLHQLATFGVGNRLFTPLQWLHSLVQLFFYLLFYTQKGETVFIYHSYYLSLPVLLAKQIKKFHLVLEVEEIYQDVLRLPAVVCHLEKKVIRIADGYILSTKALQKEVNPENRPMVVINGTYAEEPDRGAAPFDDGKIHCVYAGTLDLTKGGAPAAADAAAFLPERYHLHILGFGTGRERQALLQKIRTVQERCRCTLTFDGLMQGEEYIRFLQRCQIGLSTQIPDAKYAATSFPSKILVYMANGLRVVSVRIPVVEQSDVSDLIDFYDTQTPEKIAEAIGGVDLDAPYDSRKRLRTLHEQAGQALKKLLEDVL